jgi:hypothetical protein
VLNATRSTGGVERETNARKCDQCQTGGALEAGGGGAFLPEDEEGALQGEQKWQK